MRRMMLGFAAVVVAATVQAAEYRDENMAVELPAGYEGPETQRFPQGQTYGFKKSHPGTPTSSLYQVTVYDFGDAVKNLGEGTAPKDKYLRQFLDGIRARRTEMSVGEVADAKIGNRPARTATWRGRAQGRMMVGQMYVTVVGSRVYALNIQDFEEYADAAMPELRQMVAGTRLFRAKASEVAAAPATRTAQPPARTKVSPQQLSNLVGGRVRITLKDGRVREGLINAVEDQTAILSVDGTSGGMTYPIAFSTMADIELRQ